MALNLKNPEVDRLASEVANLANESKTEAIRRALLERKARLTASGRLRKRSERAASILDQFRAGAPPAILGKHLTPAEEDEILGYGPGGV